MDISKLLIKIYKLLRKRFGYLNWWPAETPLEMAIGAILTQNVAWDNVEKSIRRLKERGLLEIESILNTDPKIIKECISPSGYYNIKYNRLISLLLFIKNELEGNIQNLKKYSLKLAREKLLLVNGVGKETADSILLYAVNFPIFVVDAYTKRAFYRIGVLKSPNMDYDEVQSIFMNNLKKDVRLFNDYHAQIVELSKNYCKKKPLCESCPLFSICRKRIK